LQRLKESAEKAKCELSSTLETNINLPFITADANGPKQLNLTLSRAKLEQLVDDLIERTIEPCKKALADAGLSVDQINEVVLVGGMTRMPKVQEIVRNLFGKEPHKGVNPDEVVAVGAAIQGGVLAGDVKDVLLLDVTPLSLGIETLGGVFTKLIDRNTTIPTRKSEIFTTAENSQTSVEIHVLQGERPMARDNRTLARFILDGIPPSPRGVPQVEVAFDIDADGILHAFAKDLATQKEQKIRVEASSGLSKEQIDQMVRDADEKAEEDKKRRELVDNRNQLDELIYRTEKSFKEFKDRLSDDERKELEESLEEGKQAVKGEDLGKIQRSMDRITKASHKIAELMYKQAAEGASEGGDGFGAEGPAEGEAAGAAGTQQKKEGGDDVIDAEFTEE
jgi:molecular chaperone DnaK